MRYQFLLFPSLFACTLVFFFLWIFFGVGIFSVNVHEFCLTISYPEHSTYVQYIIDAAAPYLLIQNVKSLGLLKKFYLEWYRIEKHSTARDRMWTQQSISKLSTWKEIL